VRKRRKSIHKSGKAIKINIVFPSPLETNIFIRENPENINFMHNFFCSKAKKSERENKL